MTWQFDGWPRNIKGHLFYTTWSCVHHFRAISAFKLELQSRNTQSGSNSSIFLSRVTLKFDTSLWKTTRHLLIASSGFVHRFITIDKFNLELQSGNTHFWSKSTIFYRRDLKIWRITLKINSGHLLCFFKLFAPFHSHLWNQKGVIVRKCHSYIQIIK